MGLDFQVRPVLTDPVGLDNYELYAMAKIMHQSGEMLHIQDDTYIRQVSHELDVAREGLAGITFAG